MAMNLMVNIMDLTMLEASKMCACCCSYECVRCGERSRFDNKFEADDNIDEAYMVMDNLKAALANK